MGTDYSPAKGDRHNFPVFAAARLNLALKIAKFDAGN
jgi:hypothetical protein